MEHDELKIFKGELFHTDLQYFTVVKLGSSFHPEFSVGKTDNKTTTYCSSGLLRYPYASRKLHRTVQ